MPQGGNQNGSDANKGTQRLDEPEVSIRKTTPFVSRIDSWICCILWENYSKTHATTSLSNPKHLGATKIHGPGQQTSRLSSLPPSPVRRCKRRDLDQVRSGSHRIRFLI
jgi:hypothetical protein